MKTLFLAMILSLGTITNTQSSQLDSLIGEYTLLYPRGGNPTLRAHPKTLDKGLI